MLALFGLFIFRRFMAERSIAHITGFLAITTTLLTLPTLGMVYGLHDWTSRLTDGAVGARTLMLVNTTISSPLSQLAAGVYAYKGLSGLGG